MKGRSPKPSQGEASENGFRQPHFELHYSLAYCNAFAITLSFQELKLLNCQGSSVFRQQAQDLPSLRFTKIIIGRSPLLCQAVFQQKNRRRSSNRVHSYSLPLES
ncbi:MAG: hypothetical protein HC849_11630 [Oscillatoriales cyanobacterium RU_3_3]|nr:hypothetical protein [Oscillatoriales cyanobacterium RU_3_3]